MSCRACGEVRPPNARFCPSCGQPLDASTSGPAPRTRASVTDLAGTGDQERKQITAMFIDIVGSMDVAERVGDERWRDILHQFFATASGAVLHLEGTVHQFTGDGIMALFGAPLAQEDHARRACLAALDVHDRLSPLATALADDGVGLAIRIGLHSGEVIVGTIGDEMQMDWAAIGHTTGVAKRMEALAPPGSTTVSATTAALTSGEFEFAPLGWFPVKGISGPQEVFELRERTHGFQGRLDADLQRGTLSPLVGRGREQRILEDAFGSASAGDGRAVVLVGEPGMGKSRLTLDVIDRCASAGVAIHRVIAEPHGQVLPLQPVLALVRSMLGVGSRDDPAAARASIEAVLDGLETSFADDLPLVFDMLGVPAPDRPAPAIDPDGRRRHLLSFVTRVVGALSRRRPIVIVCEDLHWFDEASRGYFAALVGAAAGTRTLVLATTRPEYQADELPAEPHLRRICLQPLDGAALRALLTEILGTDSSLDGLAELIAERAAGNPFFCEELVVALSQTGHLSGQPGAYVLAETIERLVLPPTVQATLAARIDRLGTEAKLLVHDAAVIGMEFEAPLLAELSRAGLEEVGRTLRTLTEAEMVTAAGDGGGARYVFRHPLIREVAYHAQLTSRRRATHARLAEAIARLHADNPDEQAALIAHHSEEAGLILDAARWQARAARWAERTSPQMGMSHWEAARRLADSARAAAQAEEDEAESAVLSVEARVGILNQAWRVGVPLTEQRAIHGQGIDLIGRHEMPAQLRLFLDWGLFASLLFTGHERDAYPVAVSNMELAAQIGDPALLLTTAAGSAYGAFVVGRTAEAVATADRGLAAAGGDVTMGAGILLANPYAHALLIRGICTCLAGDVPAAGEQLGSALSIAEAHDAPEMATYAHWGLALVSIASADAASAQSHAHAACELARRAGNAWGQTMAQHTVAWAHLVAGDMAAAEEACREGLHLITTSGVGHHYEPVLRTGLAQAMLGSGRIDAALQEAAAAADLAQQRGLGWAELPARLALALVLLSAGRTAEAGAAVSRGMTLTEETGIHLYDRALRSAGRRSGTAAAV